MRPGYLVTMYWQEQEGVEFGYEGMVTDESKV